MARETAASRTATDANAKRRGLTISPKVIGAGLIVIAAVWFIVVNRGRVSIYLWVPKVTAPLWLVLLITFAAGALTGLLVRRAKKRSDSAYGSAGPG